MDAVLTAAGDPELPVGEVREGINADPERRSQNAVSNAKARADKTERLADENDDAVIGKMNAKRVEEGKEPLSEQQEASVRDQRRRRREKPS